MGNSKFLDSLSSDEYKQLTKKLLESQRNTCFICGKIIDPEIHHTNIDHIKPLVNGGKDQESNFAVTHESCNKSKQDADLEVAQTICRLNNIIEKATCQGETPSLKHVLNDLGGSIYDINLAIDGDRLKYSFDKLGKTDILTTPVFRDTLSGELTAFIDVPIQYLYHDDDLNPRGLNSSVNLLIKEFHKPNPQLQISLARYDDNKIKLFDGQHKTVAQIMLGARSVLVRLFINSDFDKLMETNLAAGKQLRQIAFDKAIVRELHDGLYSIRLDRYRAEKGLEPDDCSFSEQNVVDYFKGEKAVKTYVINSQKNAITNSTENKLKNFINFEGRGHSHPLSYSTFEKTILSTFINSKTILSTPIGFKVEEGQNPRILERDQTIRICNLIAEELLVDRFDDEIGTYRLEDDISKEKDAGIPEAHIVACRMFKEEVLHGWIGYVRLIIESYCAINGAMYDKDNLLQRKYPDVVWTNVRNFLINLRELPLWKNRSLSNTVFGGKNPYVYWETIFNSGKTPDGTTVISNPLNINDMIKTESKD